MLQANAKILGQRLKGSISRLSDRETVREQPLITLGMSRTQFINSQFQRPDVGEIKSVLKAHEAGVPKSQTNLSLKRAA
jgi:hypothetical protein